MNKMIEMESEIPNSSTILMCFFHNYKKRLSSKLKYSEY